MSDNSFTSTFLGQATEYITKKIGNKKLDKGYTLDLDSKIFEQRRGIKLFLPLDEVEFEYPRSLLVDIYKDQNVDTSEFSNNSRDRGSLTYEVIGQEASINTSVEDPRQNKMIVPNSKYFFLKIACRYNEYFLKMRSIWSFVYSAYVGGKEFIDNFLLVRNPKESDKNFRMRKELSIYINDTKSVVDIIAGFITRTNPNIKIDDTQGAEISDDIKELESDLNKFFIDNGIYFDYDGKNNIHSFFNQVTKLSQIYPIGIQLRNYNLYDYEDNRHNIYISLLNPANIIDFSMNCDGMLNTCSLVHRTNLLISPFHEKVRVDIYEVITTSMVYIYFLNVDKSRVFRYLEIPNEYGFIPVLFSNAKGLLLNNLHRSNIEDVSLASKTKTNAMSSLIFRVIKSSTRDKVAVPVVNFTQEEKLLKNPDIIDSDIIPYHASQRNKPELLTQGFTSTGNDIVGVLDIWNNFLFSLGLDKDENKKFGSSSISKNADLLKIKNIILDITNNIENLYNSLFCMCYLMLERDSNLDPRYSDLEINKLTDLIIRVNFPQNYDTIDNIMSLDMSIRVINQIKNLPFKDNKTKEIMLGKVLEKIFEYIISDDGNEFNTAVSGIIDDMLDENGGEILDHNILRDLVEASHGVKRDDNSSGTESKVGGVIGQNG